MIAISAKLAVELANRSAGRCVLATLLSALPAQCSPPCARKLDDDGLPERWDLRPARPR